MAEQKKATVSWDDLTDAYLFVDSGSPGENEAFLNLETGEPFYRSALLGDDDELPEDIDDEPEKYLPVPDKRELNLGKRLALQFVAEFLPADLGRAENIFSRRGAYGRFKDMLELRNALEKWYDYENEATQRALRAWCEENDIEIVNAPSSMAGDTTENKGTGQLASGSTDQISADYSRPRRQELTGDTVTDADLIELVRATESDLSFIMATERTPGYEDLVGRSDQAQHRAQLADASYAYFVARLGKERVGFAIVRDWASPEQVTLIKRLAVARPGQGHGRALVARLVDRIFGETSAYRVCIGLFPENTRARRAYEAAGFQAEGIARGNVLFGGVHRDELIMAILRPEWPGGKSGR
jgi:RimJ/RimL family protein N-acetyltransferase